MTSGPTSTSRGRTSRWLTYGWPYIVWNVEAGITARSASGPLFMLSWNFVCITPTTVNGTSSTYSVRPTAGSPSNRRCAIESPRKTTRRRSFTSFSFRNRPPLAANMVRISPNAGCTPSMNVRVRLLPAASVTDRPYDALTRSTSGMVRRISSMSASVSRTRRPFGNPSNGTRVSPP